MLTRFGFTDYENRVYETLHHAGKPMTGYALAKDSGVPRGKIYEVLTTKYYDDVLVHDEKIRNLLIRLRY